ncbi:MAG: hypothetical protein IMY85_05090 [Chloroflexi bacterium]|nr:hypothetical protein [Chloroflexota bacterium]
MRRLTFLNVLAFIIFTGSLIFLAWGYYPALEGTKKLRVPGVGQQSLAWTSRIRKGETGSLKLDFDSAELGIGGIAASGSETNNFESIRQFPLHSTDHILLETRVELPGVLIQPGEELIQPLQSGEKLTFNWQFTPFESGEIEGEIWIYLNILSEDQSNDSRHPISILSIHVLSIDLFGMTGRTARILGIMGVCIALVLWRDLIGDFANRFLKRQRNP